MIASKRRYETRKEWQDFLSQTNGSLKVSRHVHERFKEKFPDLPEPTDQELLSLIKQAKPLYSCTYPDKNLNGMVVRNEKILFAICLDLKMAMTVYPYKKNKLRKMRFHQPNHVHLKKTAYKRSGFKHEARQIISEN